MSIKKIAQFFGIALVGALMLVGCGGSSATTTPDIGVDGEQLAFNKTTLSVPAGQNITLTFKNGSTSQQHNWVLVKEGTADAVDEAAASNGGVVPDGTDGVINAGNLLDAGGSEQIQFQVPAGTYTYLCTVPGHYAAGMKGTLTSQ